MIVFVEFEEYSADQTRPRDMIVINIDRVVAVLQVTEKGVECPYTAIRTEHKTFFVMGRYKDILKTLANT
jgi:hypothetical protein